MENTRFPVGGPKQPVFDFLRGRGFEMHKATDKWWVRDGNTEVHLYGAGSMAKVYFKPHADGPTYLLSDADIETAIKNAEQILSNP